MQGSDAGRLRDPRVPRIPPVVVLACWALGALVFAFLPRGSDAKTVIATIFSLSAAAFAAVALLRAARRRARAGLPATSQPACDAALLFLGLVVASTPISPRFSTFLTRVLSRCYSPTALTWDFAP